jgi:hypothetical protein
VRKVVTPPSTSRQGVDPDALTLNRRSSMGLHLKAAAV